MRKTRAILLVAAILPIAACGDLNPTQQRALTGSAAGAAGGAIIGAIAGNAGMGAAIGAGAGLVGGLLVDHSKRQQQAAYERGLAEGRGGS
ncbi:MAG: glycine zipper family protein [Pseudomonadota bacterium]